MKVIHAEGALKRAHPSNNDKVEQPFTRIFINNDAKSITADKTYEILSFSS
jgi:hypothetical protein